MPDSTTPNKRQRLEPIDPAAGPVGDDAFVQDRDAIDGSGDDDEDDEKPKDKKAGRRKIKIEFIQDKSRRHITFSKRKAGIMKKARRLIPCCAFVPCIDLAFPCQAYELSTLTGTQVLLLVVSETGLVYTFTTAKLQPLVTQPEGKNLIQACLNAPHGQLPSSMPVGTPLGRQSGPIPGPPHSPSQPAPPPNVPGGLAIGGKDEESNENDGVDSGVGAGDVQESDRSSRKRRRASSTTTPPNARGAAQPPPPPPPATSNAQANAAQQPAPPPTQQTSPHARQPVPLPNALAMPGAPPPQSQMQPQSPSYAAYPGQDPNAGAMYPGYAAQPGAAQGAPYYVPQPPQPGHEQQQPGMTWGPAPGVQQNNHYGRR